MFKTTIHHVKLLLLLLIDLLYRCQKVANYIWHGKHEVERILDAPEDDVYEKTMKIDQWLARTRCTSIQAFVEQHFGKSSHNQSNHQTQTTTNSKPKQAISRILSMLSTSYGATNDDPAVGSHHTADQDVKRRSSSKGKSSRTTSKGKNGGDDKFDSEKRLTNLEDGDVILSSVLKQLTRELFKVIKRKKGLDNLSTETRECFEDILYRILCYKMSTMLADQLAATRYDADSELHTAKLISLWNNLIRADQLQPQTTQCNNQQQQQQPSDSCSRVFPPELSSEINDKSAIVSGRWSHIGFQGEDPGTDFRGMGLLGLAQLEYLSRKPRRLARDLLKRSLNDEHSYPFAIVGINLTFNLLGLFRDGSMKHLYYDTGDVLFRNKQRALNPITTFNDIYVELYLRFDCFWHESKPATIFEFKSLMEKFVDVVRMDLSSRTFSLKFIY